MTGVYFDNDVVILDGKEHSLFVELPVTHPINMDDITYEYYLDGELLKDSEGNPVKAVSEAGEYTVIAKFAVSDHNFEEIAPLEAILRIEEAK
jgi:hypothetical protein